MTGTHRAPPPPPPPAKVRLWPIPISWNATSVHGFVFLVCRVIPRMLMTAADHDAPLLPGAVRGASSEGDDADVGAAGENDGADLVGAGDEHAGEEDHATTTFDGASRLRWAELFDAAADDVVGAERGKVDTSAAGGVVGRLPSGALRPKFPSVAQSVFIPVDATTGRSKSTAFIHFTDLADANQFTATCNRLIQELVVQGDPRGRYSALWEVLPIAKLARLRSQVIVDVAADDGGDAFGAVRTHALKALEAAILGNKHTATTTGTTGGGNRIGETTRDDSAAASETHHIAGAASSTMANGGISPSADVLAASPTPLPPMGAGRLLGQWRRAQEKARWDEQQQQQQQVEQQPSAMDQQVPNAKGLHGTAEGNQETLPASSPVAVDPTTVKQTYALTHSLLKYRSEAADLQLTQAHLDLDRYLIDPDVLYDVTRKHRRRFVRDPPSR